MFSIQGQAKFTGSLCDMLNNIKIKAQKYKGNYMKYTQ